MKIYGLVVMKNEEDRYLEKCLEWNSRFLDELFIYDDRSTDDSVNIAETFGTVAVRGENDSSFMENEGRFRQDAWDLFETTIKPEEKSWVLAFDCDEFLTLKSSGKPEDIRKYLETIALKAGGYNSHEIPFVEVFDVDGQGKPSYRSDGFWNTIRAPRFFAFKQGGKFADKVMGCGSVPMYVVNGSVMTGDKELVFLHYGYAVFEDRTEKFDRYSSLENSGHNPTHINSILGRPELHQWFGPHPDLS